MKLTAKHHHAIQLLLEVQSDGKPEKVVAEKLGVTNVSLSRWKADPAFQAAFQEALRRWRKAIEHIPFVHRRVRLEEMQRLYEDTPDSETTGFIELKGKVLDGLTGTLVDYGEGRRVAIRRYNTAEKARLLEHVSHEVGGDAAEELANLRHLLEKCPKTP